MKLAVDSLCQGVEFLLRGTPIPASSGWDFRTRKRVFEGGWPGFPFVTKPRVPHVRTSVRGTNKACFRFVVLTSQSINRSIAAKHHALVSPMRGFDASLPGVSRTVSPAQMLRPCPLFIWTARLTFKSRLQSEQASLHGLILDRQSGARGLTPYVVPKEHCTAPRFRDFKALKHHIRHIDCNA